MQPLGQDLLDILPFRDPAVCERVRGLPDVTVREAQHHPEFHIRVVDDADGPYRAMAEDMFRRIVQARQAGERFVAVFPVGPTGQYPLLAEMINQQQVSCSHVHLFFMDEYAHPDGRTIDKNSPWSFERIAQEKLLESISSEFCVPADQVHFPGPDNIDRYDELILEASDGQGAEVVYGGIGWNGHFAFWDSHLWAEFGDDVEAWKRAHSSLVRLHPLTILQNSLRAGGDWSAILPCAYTMGPAVFLGARHRSFWLDAQLGGGMSWQRFIGRLATHGPVTPLIPASFLQTLPGETVFSAGVAEAIGGPVTSWQTRENPLS